MLLNIPDAWRDENVRGVKCKQEIKDRYPIFFDGRGFLNNNPWPLPNLEKSSFYEFYWCRSGRTFNAEGHIFNCEYEGRMHHAFVYIIDHGHMGRGGYVVLWRYDYQQKPEPIVLKWAICKHEFEQKRLGNCWHLYTCKHCGLKYDVASSA